MDLFSGNLAWHLLGNYTDEQTQILPPAVGVTSDSANSLGPNSVTAGFPKFRATLSATYTQGQWEGTLQGRFIGSAVLNNAWQNGATVAGTNNPFVDDNNVPFVAYLDMRGSYKWNDNIQFYGAIDNAANTPPPLVAITSSNIQAQGALTSTNNTTYDLLGRAFRVGVRFNY